MVKEENKKKKRKLKWQIKLILLIIFLLIYAFFIGTKGIFIKEYKVSSTKVLDDMHGFKILQFSDLHYMSSVNKRDVKKMVKKINTAKADMVIFTGDLLNKDHKFSNEEKDFLTKELSKINSEYGKYYVNGEDDFDDSSSILNIAGFTGLDLGEQIIYINSDESILLVNEKNAKKYFDTSVDNNSFNILVTHNPNNFDKVKKYNFDMVIAGHTHNGQINIPYVKNLFIDGKYDKNYQKIGNTRLYINPGIGTKKINVRLFNHPTMNLYRLNKASNK